MPELSTGNPQGYSLRAAILWAYKAIPPQSGGIGVWVPWRVQTPVETVARAWCDYSTAIDSSPISIGQNPVGVSRRLGRRERGNHVSAPGRDRLLRASQSRRGACELGTAIRSRAQALNEASTGSAPKAESHVTGAGNPCQDSPKAGSRSAVWCEAPEALRGNRYMPKHLFKPGSRNKNWKGGRTITEHGYVLVKMPGHPLADVRGYVYEHRLIAEQEVGRRLRKGEEAHHRNHTRDDNANQNILVCPTKLHHAALHRKAGSKYQRDPDNDVNTQVECACGCGESFLKFDRWGRIRRYVTGHNLHG
jgi:HNH endonuclease